jgi:Uncharacterized protein conserved in bacteria (DUF2252)
VLRRRQAQRSVLAGYAGQSEHRNQGERVVTGQHLMQAVSDIFLGWQRAPSRPRFGRLLLPAPAARLEIFRRHRGHERRRPDRLRAHVRLDSGPRPRPHRDRIAIAAYLGGSGTFDQAVADFAETYADQTERDHAALADAVTSGRVQAQTGI